MMTGHNTNKWGANKVCDSQQKIDFWQKVREFCSTFSCNPNSFLELGSQDAPLFTHLVTALAVGGLRHWSLLSSSVDVLLVLLLPQ